MGRPLLTDRPRYIRISLPSSVADEIELRLFSPLQNRVPHGEWSRFFETLARKALADLNSPKGTENADR